MMNAPSDVSDKQLKELNIKPQVKKIIIFYLLRLIFTSDKSTRFFL